jgi:hypothetical protein
MKRLARASPEAKVAARPWPGGDRDSRLPPAAKPSAQTTPPPATFLRLLDTPVE